MRSKKEILEILLENIEHIYFEQGLCILASNLHFRKIITREELQEISFYIKNNRPCMFSSIYALLSANSRYYWVAGEIKPRVKWLKKHIQKLS